MSRAADQPRMTADMLARALRVWAGLNEVLARLLPLARGLVRIIRLVAMSGFVAAALILFGVLLGNVPTTWWSVVALVIFAGALCIPSGILLLFHGALV